MPENPFLRISPETSFSKEALQGTVFVDVGEKVIDAQVVRDGIDVGLFKLDPDRLDEIIGGRRPVPQRVISQSIEPGVAVAEGTTVDLVLAPTFTFPAGVVTGVLTSIADQELGDLHRRLVLENLEDTNRILAKVGPGGTLPATEEARLRQIFQGADIGIGDTPGDNVAAAVETLRAASIFGA